MASFAAASLAVNYFLYDRYDEKKAQQSFLRQAKEFGNQAGLVKKILILLKKDDVEACHHYVIPLLTGAGIDYQKHVTVDPRETLACWQAKYFDGKESKNDLPDYAEPKDVSFIENGVIVHDKDVHSKDIKTFLISFRKQSFANRLRSFFNRRAEQRRIGEATLIVIKALQ